MSSESWTGDPPRCSHEGDFFRFPTDRKPHKCPVCDGTGLVSKPVGMAGDQTTWVTDNVEPHQCHACIGSGVLWSGE